MKKSFFRTFILVWVLLFPVSAMAEVDIGVNISLPLPIVFVSPPELIVVPETYVYVVPDVDAEIFFYNGWWWRPWEGRWYRSRDYNSGWTHYRKVPSFYRDVPPGWRNEYKKHAWKGHRWNYQRIPHEQVQRDWRGWKKSGHWEKEQTWGVQDLRPQQQTQQPPREAQPRQQMKPDHSRQHQQQQTNPQSRKNDKSKNRGKNKQTEENWK